MKDLHAVATPRAECRKGLGHFRPENYYRSQGDGSAGAIAGTLS
jgi:hypothetical protein